MSESKITKPMIEKMLKFTNLRKLLGEFLKTTGKLEVNHFVDFTEEEKREIIDGAIKTLDIENYLLPIYQKHFTAEELLDIIAFFRSKSGQKYVAEQQMVSDAVMAVVPKLTLELTISLASEIARKRREQ